MKPLHCFSVCGLLAVFALELGASGASWQLVWSDEFNGTNIDRGKWTYDTGGNGWGNGELQYYTERRQNSYLSKESDGSGVLVIEARPESYRDARYTSARMKTQGLQNLTYGRVEARMKIPGGKGVWPAFWMLGSNFPTAGWPACGEIDILEHVEAYDMGANSVRASLHGPVRNAANSIHGDTTVSELTSRYHVFAVEWEPAEVRWYVDSGKPFFTSKSDAVAGNWVFDHPFFIIMNVAVGGVWPGAPDASTLFPARMCVDYVRVYRDANLRPPPVTKPTTR